MRSLTVLAAVLLASCAQHPIAPSAASFDWLAGCWQLERADGSRYEEAWLPATKDGTVGTGREIRGGRTVSWEFERIELRQDGSIVFFAQPAGQDVTEFHMVEHAPGVVAFENAQHDFPARIEYRYVDLNAVTATLSGHARKIEYPLQRMDCQG